MERLTAFLKNTPSVDNAEWEMLKSMLQRYTPIWNTAEYDGAVSRFIPRTALMGNGDTGVNSAGNSKEKSYLISKQDFWNCGDMETEAFNHGDPKRVSPLSVGGLTIRMDNCTNQTNDTDSEVNCSEIGIVGTFKEIQHIDDGVLNTDMLINDSPLLFSSWVSATENVFVTEVKSIAKKPVTLEVALWTKGDFPEFPLSANVEGDIILATKKTKNYVENMNEKSWTSEVAMASKIIGLTSAIDTKNSEFESGIIFTLNSNETVTILTAIGGGGQNYDWQGKLQGKNPKKEAVEILNRYCDDTSVAELKKANDVWWKNYWMKSYIDIGNEKLHNYYYGSLYYMACTSRPDKLAPSIFGVWTTTDGAMWNGDYHMNYNFIAPFYGIYSSNRHEFAKPLKDPMLDYIEEGKRRAKQSLSNVYPAYINGGKQPEDNGTIINKGMFDGRKDLEDGIDDAVLFPVALGPWGATTWGGSNDGYLMQVYDAVFSAQAITTYYNYSKDSDYLKEVYPFLLLNANFYEKWCEKEVLADGGYRYNIWTGAHEETFDLNSCNALGAVKNLLECLIDGVTDGAISPPSEKLSIWRDMYENLADYPIEKYTLNGEELNYISLSEVGVKIRADNAHVALEFISPSQQLGFDSDLALCLAARNAIKIKEITDSVCWNQSNNTPKIFAQAMRCGYDTAHVIGKFEELLTESMHSNFTIEDGQHGIEKAGAIEFINEMMLQSDNGIIKVFPNWTGEDAIFVRLRERGAFLVSAQIKDAEVKYIELMSEKGFKAKIVNPWSYAIVVDSQGNIVKTVEGVTVNSNEVTIEFDTIVGETYSIVKSETDIV